jgi:hypothetical protein
MIDFSLVKNMAPSTIQKFRIISLVSGGLSMGQIAGRIRVPPGGHFFACITLFNGQVPPEVIGDYCDR